jgi:hypothetical protein
MPIPPDDLAGKFLAEIEAAISKHSKACAKDSRWHLLIMATGFSTSPSLH